MAVLYIVYLILQWIIGKFPIVPPVLLTVLNIVFGVLAFVIVLQFLAALLGVNTGYNGFRLN